MGQPLEVHIRKLQEFYWSEADPDGRGFVPLADALRKAGQYQEARRLLRDGLRRHPDFLAGHIVSAWLSMDEGGPAEAEAHFQTAMELDPRNIAALRGLAELHLERGDEDSALDYLEALLTEDPVDLDLPVQLRVLREKLEEKEETRRRRKFEGEGLPWEDPLGIEEEVDWEEAVLQPDSGSPPPSDSQEETLDEPGRSPLIVEDGEPIPAEGELDDALITPTLGEIYLRQGLLGRAEGVFESLLEGDPENEHLRRRLDEVRELLRTQGFAGEDSGPVRHTPELGDTDAWEPAAVAPAAEVAERLPEDLPGEIVPIESLAPDRATAGPSAPDGTQPHGAVDVGDLAPEEAIPIESFAPDEPISIELLAPDGPIPIEALAPSEPVPIGSLAPSEPVPIGSLAPDQGGESFPSTAEAGEQSDSTIQDFERWLDKFE